MADVACWNLKISGVGWHLARGPGGEGELAIAGIWVDGQWCMETADGEVGRKGRDKGWQARRQVRVVGWLAIG